MSCVCVCVLCALYRIANEKNNFKAFLLSHVINLAYFRHIYDEERMFSWQNI